MNLDEFTASMMNGAATAASAQQGLPKSVFAGVSGGTSVRQRMPLGAVSLPSGSWWTLAMYVTLAGTAGFFAGRAMADVPSQQNAYGAAGALASIVLGPVGLGALGIYALYQR